MVNWHTGTTFDYIFWDLSTDLYSRWQGPVAIPNALLVHNQIGNANFYRGFYGNPGGPFETMRHLYLHFWSLVYDKARADGFNPDPSVVLIIRFDEPWIADPVRENLIQEFKDHLFRHHTSLCPIYVTSIYDDDAFDLVPETVLKREAILYPPVINFVDIPTGVVLT